MTCVSGMPGLDRHLRADGIKVAVFRQTRSGETWVDAQVNPDTPAAKAGIQERDVIVAFAGKEVDWR